jgi:hypothetical protein
MLRHTGEHWLSGFVAPAALASCFVAVAFSGCERKERVVDVKTPAGNVTVDRNIDNGKVEVEATKK